MTPGNAPEGAVDVLAGLEVPPVPVPDWTGALCAQADPEAWFPARGSTVRPAVRVCRACPIEADCLEWALATDQRFGVWGGQSERSLRKLRKARKAATSADVDNSVASSGVAAMMGGSDETGGGREAVPAVVAPVAVSRAGDDRG